jgi:predicted metalloprotease with PDZ domain
MPLTRRTSWLAAALLLWSSLTSAAPPVRPLELTVDATDAPRGIFHARLVVPASPGPMALAYPKWIQGEHTPSGPITQLVGLSIKAGGAVVPWRRDPIDQFLFRLEVPVGADSVTVEYDYLSPVGSFGSGYGKTPNATPHLLIVDWHDVVLFPAGPAADDIPVRARLRLPAGWKFDTALAFAIAPDGAVTFSPVSLYTLIDSPVLAGDHFRTEVIEAGDRPARLSVAADRASALEIPAERLAAYRRLPLEARALFGASHYTSYHWLVALGDTLDDNGLEHHESTDIRLPIGFFSDESIRVAEDFTIPHEYIHSWNGKFRRPAGLATRDTQQPFDAELLWVYEGLTRYLDMILPARSGMNTVAQSRDYLAWRAARQDRDRPGRRWRPLVDTAVSAPTIWDGPSDWTNYRRSGKDYYDESMLVWLEADTILREQTAGKRSLDDFCRDFFGGADGPPSVKPYTRADVEAALAQVAAFDWHGFFTARVYDIAPKIPLGGIEGSGWTLVYDARPNGFQRAWDTIYKQVDQTMSIGLQLSPTGVVQDVVLDSAAWNSGFGPGMTIVSVNGRPFTPAAFEEQLNAATSSAGAIEFVVRHGEDARTLRVDYHGGVLYPHLERNPSRPDVLAAILAPRADR